MRSIEYKGFNIIPLSLSGAGCRVVEWDKEYSSESVAKGQITKYLKQQEQAEQELSNPPSANNPEEFIVWLEESVNTINKIAERVYSTSVQQSRNKREGYFCGITDYRVVRLKGFKKVVNTNYEPKNRKQRKAAKLAWWKQVDNVCDKLFG